MYSIFIRKIENIFVILMTYVVPAAVIILLGLMFWNVIPTGQVEKLFANGGWNLLIFILMIKPILVLTKRYLNPTYRKLPDGILYLTKGRTQDPILIYIRNLIVNTVYSLCLYGIKLRKRLGILVFRMIFLHRSILEIATYHQGMSFLFLRGNRFIQTGVAGLAALIIGAITSNMFSIKLFQRRWKLIQQIAYIAFITASLHLFFIEYERSYIIVLIIYIGLKIWERLPRKVKPIIPQAQPTVQTPDAMKARIINRKALTPNVMEFTIEVREELKIIPGQRALFTFQDKDGNFNRTYSIVDYDVDQGSTLFIIAVKLIGGRGTAILANMKIGDEVLFRGIYGKFILQNTDKPKIFIGTGVGIAPLINMAKHSENKQKKLYFSVPYVKDLFYEERLKEIKDIVYEIHITREAASGYTFGRLDIDKADINPNAEIYICGNPQIIEDIVQKLKAKGCQNIFSEKF